MIKSVEELYNTKISSANSAIVENLDKIIENERGYVSTNVLSHVRNLLDGIAGYIFFKETGSEYNYENGNENTNKSWKYLKSEAKFKDVVLLHETLQKTTSHDSPIGEFAERVLINIYEGLLLTKLFVKKNYGFKILENIDKYPLDMDDTFIEYYSNVLSRMNNLSGNVFRHFEDMYYVQKKKMIYFQNTIFYELTLISANDYASKNDRFVVFSSENVLVNYAIKARIVETVVNVFNIDIPIQIMLKYDVSIRPCELNHISEIFPGLIIYSRTKEYEYLMSYIKDTCHTLDKIVLYPDNKFEELKNMCYSFRNHDIICLLEKLREVILNKETGSNVLLYLLHTMNNNIIRKQVSLDKKEQLGRLYLKKKTFTFDCTPFCASLIMHNPPLYLLLNIFDFSERVEELIVRHLNNISNQDGILYVDKDDIYTNEEIDKQHIIKYNKSLPEVHNRRRICGYKGNLYVKGNELDTIYVIEELLKFCNVSVKDYNYYAKRTIESKNIDIDDTLKKETILHMFENSTIYVIYGAAGTGKSTLVGKELTLFDSLTKLCLANTHPAVENMKRKINSRNTDYMTITAFLSSKNEKKVYDILVIDECSCVSSSQMKDILNKIECKIILLIGDIFQIPSIMFGNWFGLLKYFIPSYSYVELSNQFRSDSPVLKMIWESVRTLKNDVFALLNKYDISHKFDETIFQPNSDDEIVLCLNYGGLYGVNNMNKILQLANPNDAISWGTHIFKKGDKILFNESSRFSNVLYNNLKGEIVDIFKDKERITFRVEVDRMINELELDNQNIKYISSNNGKTTVEFWVKKHKDADYDNDSTTYTSIPFQLAYAVSIHKAQGIEYDSVKVIVTNELEEKMTHNIFYTAITRAKKDLTIYWSPEVEYKILKSFNIKRYDKDAALLKSRMAENRE